jgi:cytochrome P450
MGDSEEDLGRGAGGSESGGPRFPKGDPPGPDRLPIVGNALPFFRRPFEYRTWVASTFGDVVDVSGLGRRAFLVSHPEDIRQILVTDDHQFVKPGFEKRFVDRAFGNSLAFVDGEQWRRARRLFQPVFTMDRIGRYGETMVETTEDVVADFPDDGTVAINEAMRRLTFAVLVRTLFDLDPERIPDLQADFEAVATKLRPFNAVVPDWIPTRSNRRYTQALDRLETTIDGIVADRRAARDEGTDLLSLLVAADDGERTLSDERLRDELMGFLFAGHETTAMALCFTCYLLATNPADQRRLREELGAVLDGGRPTVTSLGELSYLDQVVDEALRLYPPNHMIPREPTEDVAIGGYRIPAGSSVYCSQWVVHRDDRWWDEPSAFRPERWADDGTGGDRPEYAYFPFGGGRRHCIGMRFARMELRLALATALSTLRFDGAPSGEPTLAAGLTTHPTDPIELVVRRDR